MTEQPADPTGYGVEYAEDGTVQVRRLADDEIVTRGHASREEAIAALRSA